MQQREAGVFGITPEELQTAIGQLEQAGQSHDEWFDDINRTMLCHLPHNPNDVRDDAHCLCRFGQWLYQHASPRLRDHPAFCIIEKEHRMMHAGAARLLLGIAAGGRAPLETYDSFSRSLKQLRLQITTLKQELQDALYNLDSLTSANSRIGMLTYLREQHELVKRGNQHFCIAMLDLDHFKEINDRFGHSTGDQILKSVARHILDNIRPYDRLFRFGGEEFLLGMPQTALNTGATVSERLRRGIAEKSGGPHITASFGVAEFTPELTVEESIDRADQAMYSAKYNGRNSVCSWEPSMQRELAGS